MAKEFIQRHVVDSTSQKNVQRVQVHSMAGTQRPLKIEPFRYTPLKGKSDSAITSVWNFASDEEEQRAQQLEVEKAEWEAKTKEVWQDAYKQGLHAAEQEHKVQLEKLTSQVSSALRSFGSERDHYFARVEREVVELSLSIAARILQREAHIDPLLLTGAVRVALSSLHEGAVVQLRVPSINYALWAEAINKMKDLEVRPELIADDQLEVGNAVIETKLGNVDLGIGAQLKEVERGFLDLLAHREPAQTAQNDKQTH